MKGAIHKFLLEYFKSLGLSEDTLSGKTKIRSIRIQISLKGINLADHGPDTMDNPSDLDKLKSVLASLKLPAAA